MSFHTYVVECEQCARCGCPKSGEYHVHVNEQGVIVYISKPCTTPCLSDEQRAALRDAGVIAVSLDMEAQP